MGFLKDAFISTTEILPSKNRPRVVLGTHLEYEERIRGGRLRFHLERNLNTIGTDRNAIITLHCNVAADFAALAKELTANPQLAGVAVLEGITNFEEKTGQRYGFASEEIIAGWLLCVIFDNRIPKPALARDLLSAPSIRRFRISREVFLARHLTKS